jgi:UDP-glucose 4-epimerase
MLSKAMRAAYEGSPFEVYGDGQQTREFTYVADAVEATILAAERGAPGGLYNVGGGSAVTVNNVLDLLAEVSGRDIKRRNAPPHPEDHRRAGASITRARIQLGWEPRTQLRDGLAAQWRWFEEAMELEAAARTAKG